MSRERDERQTANVGLERARWMCVGCDRIEHLERLPRPVEPEEHPRAIARGAILEGRANLLEHRERLGEPTLRLERARVAAMDAGHVRERCCRASEQRGVLGRGGSREASLTRDLGEGEPARSLHRGRASRIVPMDPPTLGVAQAQEGSRPDGLGILQRGHSGPPTSQRVGPVDPEREGERSVLAHLERRDPRRLADDVARPPRR